MGIYIKDMEMPKDDQKIRFVKLLNGKIYALKETRNGWPLSYLNEVIEVTEPHGRLIDADALTVKYQEHHDFFTNAWGGFKNMPINDKARCDELSNCMADILNTSTVIEAEDEWWR